MFDDRSLSQDIVSLAKQTGSEHSRSSKFTDRDLREERRILLRRIEAKKAEMVDVRKYWTSKTRQFNN